MTTKVLQTIARTGAAALVGITAVVMPAALQGQGLTPEALSEAGTLVKLISPVITQTTKGTFSAQAWQQIEAALRARYPNIDADTLAAVRRELEGMRAGLVAQIQSEMPRIYASYFTADELRQIVAFFRTPLGAKYLAFLPYTTAEYFGREFPQMQDRQRRFMEAVQGILRSHGYDQ